MNVRGRFVRMGRWFTRTVYHLSQGLLFIVCLLQGGILLGRTKTVEHAFGAWGTNQKMGSPNNPWKEDEHHIAESPSSGSAVATAAGMAVCAIGSDTGGSVRLPAAFCGVTGLKVTEGRLECEGIMPLSQTLDTRSNHSNSCRQCHSI